MMNNKYKGIRVVCMGDSLTDNYYFHVAPSMTYWPLLVEWQTGMEMINKGISGQTTAQMLARFSDDVIVNAPNYCIIEGGSNDVYWRKNTSVQPNGFVLSKTISNIDAMVQLCKENGIVPIVCTEACGYYVPNNTPEEETTLLTELYNGIMSYVKSNDVLYIDVRGQSTIYTDASLRCPDNAHYTEQANMIVAKMVIDFFDALIPDVVKPVSPEGYDTITTTLNYAWEGSEQSRRYTSTTAFNGTTISNGALTNKSASVYSPSYTYAGEHNVLFDAVSNEFSYALPQKSTATYSPEYVWNGTGGGAVTVATWALDGISVSNGVLSLISDDAQAEIDAINGEVI